MTASEEPYRVLVVEDDEATRYAWTRLLENQGYQVTAVESVHDALTALPRGFDVLLSDQKLPDGEGTQLVRTAMERGLLATTSTVVCTAYSPPDLQKGLHMGVLHKPVTNEDLLGAVERGAREARQLQRLNARRAPRPS